MDIEVTVIPDRNPNHAQMAYLAGMLGLPYDRLCTRAHLPVGPIGCTNRAGSC
ncbi:hypothetical protein ALO65_200060 [Pseudomonas syringae pv. papulans]|nr:hypothetical protein ALO65_200060 [Pseudomonas syringae pv. papulans]